MLNPDQRREEILTDARAAAAEAGLTLKEDDGLLAEVAGLVEWPTVLIGSFDESFMGVPDEVLVTSMRSHQKYFSLLKATASWPTASWWSPTCRTTPTAADRLAGNQRVLRARLSDAKFFWETDLKHPLESWVPKLADRLYYQGLGTVADKAAARTCRAGRALIRPMPRRPARAGLLAKADLSTDMVGEFPELQGIMGRYYALKDKETAGGRRRHRPALFAASAPPTPARPRRFRWRWRWPTSSTRWPASSPSAKSRPARRIRSRCAAPRSASSA